MEQGLFLGGGGGVGRSTANQHFFEFGLSSGGSDVSPVLFKAVLIFKDLLREHCIGKNF